MPLFHLNMVIAVAIRLFLSMWPLTFGIWPLLFLTQSPPKGATIQYRPKPVVPPVIFAGGQAYTVPGQMQGVQASEVSHHSPVCGLCVFLFWMEFQIQRKETCSWCIAYLLNSLILTLLKVFCYGLNFIFIFVKWIFKKKFLLTILLTINAWSKWQGLEFKKIFY